MEIDEERSTGHRYLDMTEYWVWRQEQERTVKAETDKTKKGAA
nr:hypothetical protein [Ammonifex thiophilus]